MSSTLSPTLAGSARRAFYRFPHLTRQWIMAGALALAAVASAPAAQPVAVKPFPDDPACTAEDRKYMARAFELAADAASNGNTPYGALLVKDGKVIMEFSNNAMTSGDVTHHAETGLISASTVKLGKAFVSQCTLYTSTEPCIMCCGSIRFAGVKKIVFGCTATQVSLLHGRKLPMKPLEIREVYTRIGATDVSILGPLMEGDGLAVHATAMVNADKLKKS